MRTVWMPDDLLMIDLPSTKPRDLDTVLGFDGFDEDTDTTTDYENPNFVLVRHNENEIKPLENLTLTFVCNSGSSSFHFHPATLRCLLAFAGE